MEHSERANFLAEISERIFVKYGVAHGIALICALPVQELQNLL